MSFRNKVAPSTEQNGTTTISAPFTVAETSAKDGNDSPSKCSSLSSDLSSLPNKLPRHGITVKPGEEIVRHRGLTYLATLLNFLKSLVGAGFLSLPLAFRDAGLWSAFILLIIFAFLNCFCMMQLVKCAQHHYKRLDIPYLNFGNVARETCSASFRWMRGYGSLAKSIVNLTVLSLQFGFCSTYYLFIAVSLKEIFDELTNYHHSTMHWLLLIYLPMVLLNFIRTLRILAFFSALGNVLMISSLVFTLYYLILNPRNSIGDLPFYNNFDGLLTASGAIIYSYEAQTLVLPMENKLRRPRQMLGPFGVLSAGVFFSSLIYASMGFFGYVAYGREVKGSITLNLPQHHVSFTLVKLSLCLSVFSCFLLQMYVVVEMVWSRLSRVIIKGHIKQKKDQIRWWRLPPIFSLPCELIVRILLVTVCFTFAAAVPNLERIIPLVGITSGMLLSFVFPALIDLFTFVPLLLQRRQFCRARLRLCQDILLAGVGLFGLVAGLRANIRAMIEGNASAGGGQGSNGTTTSMSNWVGPNGTMGNGSAFLQ